MKTKYILMIFILFLLLFTQSCQIVSTGDKVQKGTFKAVITETGELKAVNSKIVSMPPFDFSYGRPKIADIVKEGTIVKEGDYVGMIDTASVARELGTKKSELDILQADLNKLLVPLNDTTNMGPIQGIFKSFVDAPGGFEEELEEIMYSVGAEYWYMKQFAVRLGYFHENENKGNRKYFTAGVGLRLNVFSLDFSYLFPTQGGRNNPLANTMRFTLGFRFE